MTDSEWTDMKIKRPKKNQVCDFVFGGDLEEWRIWMLCSVKLNDIDDYRHWDCACYWRPAQELPAKIKTFTPFCRWLDKAEKALEQKQDEEVPKRSVLYKE